MKHRVLAAACAVLLGALSLAGCGESGPKEVITEDQLGYGATFVNDFSRDIVLSYDSRFLDAALLDKIFTYYDAIQKKDGEAFGSVMFPLYHDYQMNTVYEGKKSEQDIAEIMNKAVREKYDYDYEYTFVEISDMISGNGVSQTRDSLLSMLNQLSQEKNGKKITADVQSLYELNMTTYVAEKGSGIRGETPDVLKDNTLFAIQYQNEWYLMYM